MRKNYPIPGRKEKMHLKKNCFTLLAGIIIFIVALEVAARTFLPQNEIVRDWYTFHPKMGYTVIPGLHRKIKGVEYSINSFGLRDNEYGFKHDNYRIIALGDSITMGYGVAFGDSYPKKLETLLNFNDKKKVEILNFGVPGYNTKMEYLLLEEIGMRFNPDMVILMYSLNDIFSYPESILFKLPLPVVRVIENIHNRSYFVQYFRCRLKDFVKQKDNDPDYLFSDSSILWKENKQYIREIAGLCRNNDNKLMLVIYPHSIGGRDIHALKKVCFCIQKFAESQGITTLNLFPYFDKVKEGENNLTLSEDDPHLSPQGQEMVAQAVYDFISKNNILFHQKILSD